MREITQIESYNVEIWRRPRQRNMHVTVRPNGMVRVTCGRRVPKWLIFSFVKESKDFIESRLTEQKEWQKAFPPRQYLSGEQYLYLGKRITLQLIWTWTSRIHIQLVDDELEMKAPLGATFEQRQEALRNFYRHQARTHLTQKLSFWSEQMNLFPSKVSVRGQSTRWGSCTEGGGISLNWMLMTAPADVIDYVVIHELAHLKHLNHSPDFWRLVEQFSPQWREHKDWLHRHQREVAANV